MKHSYQEFSYIHNTIHQISRTILQYYEQGQPFNSDHHQLFRLSVCHLNLFQVVDALLRVGEKMTFQQMDNINQFWKKSTCQLSIRPHVRCCWEQRGLDQISFWIRKVSCVLVVKLGKVSECLIIEKKWNFESYFVLQMLAQVLFNFLTELNLVDFVNWFFSFQIWRRWRFSFGLHQYLIIDSKSENVISVFQVCLNAGKWFAMGLTCWGIGCGSAGVPAAYVNIARWLQIN